MIRAILAGKKVQTRRAVKPQPKSDWLGYMAVEGGAIQCGPDYPDGDDDFVKCPFGSVGSKLWCRESWSVHSNWDNYSPVKISSKSAVHYLADGDKPEGYGKTRVSIHMPRWASRITLEITGVRVERMADISAKDILAEGVVDRPHEVEGLGKCPVSAIDGACYPDLKSVWLAAWAKINGKESLKANPFVWAISFRRIDP